MSSCLALVAMLHGHAHAQLRTAVIAPSGDDPRLTEPLERVIRARLSELGVAGEIESSPLGWRDLELAAGCMGEDAECYAEVAAQLGVDELVLAHAEFPPGQILVELVRWRPGHVGRRLLHEEGDDARIALFRDVEPALRALYDLPAREEVVVVGHQRSRSLDLTGPVVVAAASLGALAAGIALGVASNASRTAWQTGDTSTMHDVDLALAARDRAETEAIAADVLFATAAAGAAVATVWLIMELTSGDGGGDLAQRLADPTWRF